jgi:hypothetical protein
MRRNPKLVANMDRPGRSMALDGNQGWIDNDISLAELTDVVEAQVSK